MCLEPVFSDLSTAELPAILPALVLQEEQIITTTVLRILKENEDISDCDLGGVIHANFPKEYYKKIIVQVYQESYKFPNSSKEEDARVIKIVPQETTLAKALYYGTKALVYGTSSDDYIYNGDAIGQCLIGQGVVGDFEECSKALDNKRTIIVRVAQKYSCAKVVPDSKGLCIIS